MTEFSSASRNALVRTELRASEALSAAFEQAGLRPAAVVLDVLWKLIWLLITAALVGALLVLIYQRLVSIEIQGGAAAVQNPVAVMILFRELWALYASTIFWALSVIAGISWVTWTLLESYVRGVMAETHPPFGRSASRRFITFLASAVIKQVMLVSILVLIGVITLGPRLSRPVLEWNPVWESSRSSLLVGAVFFLTAWFILTVLETAIRTDSLEALGSQLFTILGVVASLVVIEATAVGGAAGVAVILMAFVANVRSFLVFLLALAVSVFALQIVHSYLTAVKI